ncbi:MAG: HPr family phosphocarrier protein [Candidatus Omnitrophica bacterium]|nr:HPr family phosphocarrier protein [Candidatus Omnitrophota bacterium]
MQRERVKFILVICLTLMFPGFGFAGERRPGAAAQMLAPAVQLSEAPLPIPAGDIEAETTVTISNKNGIHAKSAVYLLTRYIQAYPGEVFFDAAPITNLIDILVLEKKYNSSCKVKVKGSGAAQMLARLKQAFEVELPFREDPLVYSGDHLPDDAAIVGRKALNLFLLRKNRLPVKPFFVVRSGLHDADPKILAQELRAHFVELTQAFSPLTGASLRSSPDYSLPGQLWTILNGLMNNAVANHLEAQELPGWQFYRDYLLQYAFYVYDLKTDFFHDALNSSASGSAAAQARAVAETLLGYMHENSIVFQRDAQATEDEIFPVDRMEQVAHNAIALARFSSSPAMRRVAEKLAQRFKIDSALIVQEMVYPQQGGSFFLDLSRDDFIVGEDGSPDPWVIFVPAQFGERIAQGEETSDRQRLSALSQISPALKEQLTDYLRRISAIPEFKALLDEDGFQMEGVLDFSMEQVWFTQIRGMRAEITQEYRAVDVAAVVFDQVEDVDAVIAQIEGKQPLAVFFSTVFNTGAKHYKEDPAFQSLLKLEEKGHAVAGVFSAQGNPLQHLSMVCKTWGLPYVPGVDAASVQAQTNTPMVFNLEQRTIAVRQLSPAGGIVSTADMRAVENAI